MGFLKKLKDIAESGVEKGTDLGKKGVEKGENLEPKDMREQRMLPKKDTIKLKVTKFFFLNFIFFSK
ncbi:MAG: hypothetical protein J4F36_02410 [Nitrosopumilaceae archaeon]|nr:hypothetical protein [Nitrosopumilaceae archaeon]